MSNAKKTYQYHLDQARDIVRRLRDPETRDSIAKTLAELEKRAPDPAVADGAVELFELLARVELLEAGDLEAIFANPPSEPKLQ
jgi:hypothetical protein